MYGRGLPERGGVYGDSFLHGRRLPGVGGDIYGDPACMGEDCREAGAICTGAPFVWERIAGKRGGMYGDSFCMGEGCRKAGAICTGTPFVWDKIAGKRGGDKVPERIDKRAERGNSLVGGSSSRARLDLKTTLSGTA